MMKLISATPSPYARKVRIALLEKNIPFETITEVPWNGTTITPQYNPLEKLPILILNDGSSVYESSYILEYLDLKFPDITLLPKDVDDHLLAKKYQVLCDGICDAIVLSLFENMRNETKSQEWSDRQERKIKGGMKEMSRLLGDRQNAIGDAFTLGDLCIGVACGYVSLRFSSFSWRGVYPNLAAMSDKLEQRPSFLKTIPVAQIITDKVV